MVRLTIQKKSKGTTTKSLVCLDLLFWHPTLVLMLGILGFVKKGAAYLIRQLGVEMAGCFILFFFFSAFLDLMGSPL
jgi:hypothetical protein